MPRLISIPHFRDEVFQVKLYNQLFMYKFYTLLCVLITLTSCRRGAADHISAMDLVMDGETIIVQDNSPILRQIVVQKAYLQEFSPEFRTVGTVRPVAGKYAEIAPTFTGRIVSSSVRLGQKVGVDTPIFELSSSAFHEVTKGYLAAQSANNVAQRNYNRQRDLAANGVASQRDLEEAQSEAYIALQEFEQAKAHLRIFNVNVETDNDPSLQIGQPLKVVSPIDGEVVKSNITIGGYVREDAEPLAVVADLSKVWVAALVKEKYFGAIKQGDRVEIYTDANSGERYTNGNNIAIWGTIHYIGEMLDEETRALEVIVECDNANRNLKLGMFCEVHFLSSPIEAIILPASAVMQSLDSDYVFVEVEKGKLVRRKVETESHYYQSDIVRIISGISEGENIVIRGGIYLQ